MPTKRCREAQPQGQTFVEFALTLPALLLVLFGLAGLAVLFYSYVTMQLAVREGTNSIVHNTHQTVSQIQDTVRSHMVTLDRNDVNVIVEPSDPNTWIQGVQVSVSGVFTVSLPSNALGTIQFRAVSVMTIE
jgi:Flp pilus assembly protein TadG